MNCSVENCNRQLYCRSMCRSHYDLFLRTGSTEYSIIVGHTRCQVLGCTNTYWSKDYCQKHYCCWKRTGNPLPTRMMDHPNHCDVEGCNDAYAKGGYCQKHYMRLQRSGTIDDPPIRTAWNKSLNTICCVDGCDEKYFAVGYCHKHYNRMYYTGKQIKEEITCITQWAQIEKDANKLLNIKSSDYILCEDGASIKYKFMELFTPTGFSPTEETK